MRRTIFSDEHAWFRESVQEFVRRHIAPNKERFRTERQIDRAVWLEAGRAGFLGLSVPEAYGGTAEQTDFLFNAILGEELARAGFAYASSFGIHTDIVAPYLTERTTELQRRRWLPGFCSGELVTAIAMTEPEAGSDLRALRTVARRRGDGWTISGSKTFITNGASADLVIVAARTGGGRHGISLFAVEADNPGLRRGAKLDKVGQHEADTAELFFDDAAVGADALIGELDRGFELMMANLTQERLSSAAVNLAHARRALEVTLAYVRQRTAFGRSIGSFQSNRFTLAELDTALDVAQAHVDHCLTAHVGGQLDTVDAAKAKWWTSDLQGRVLDACVQLHGGYGYMDEYEIARSWTDGRVTRIWAGSNEIMKEIVGRALDLGETRNGAGRQARGAAARVSH